MTLFMLFLGVVGFVALVLLSAFRSHRSTFSRFELQRRAKLGDRQADEILRREELLGEAARLQAPITGLLFVLLTASFIGALGWRQGLIMAAAAALLYGLLARLALIRRLTRRLAQRYETPSLAVLKKYPVIVKLFGSQRQADNHSIKLGSHEELLHLLETSHSLFSDNDKNLLFGALDFRKKLVSEVMIDRQDAVTIAHDELLGPLVLSDLYKTGHTSFPVVHGDIDHVVGLLDIRSLLTLESELSVVAAKAMTPEVLSIPASETLYDAMRLFLRSEQQLLLVADDEGVTIGLLGLYATLNELFGRHR